MKKETSPDYDFWPDAMLPAWVVTDHELVVRKWNDFAYELLEVFGSASLLSSHTLSIDSGELPNGLKNIWNSMLDPADHHYIEAALKILRKHMSILNRFNEEGGNRHFESLLNELTKSVKAYEGVTPYVYLPKEGIFRLGVKVSPVQGLKLIMKAYIENPEVQGPVIEYIDVVMAYRLKAERSGDRFSKIIFKGVQPAIHDATERHRLWLKWKEEELENARVEEQAQVTQFLSHAFKTPISNIKSLVGELQNNQLGDDYRTKICEQLGAHVSDLSNLSDLILFINSAESIPTTFCVSNPKDLFASQTVTVDEIRSEIAKTLQSVIFGRTIDPQAKRKIRVLADESGVELGQGFGQGLNGYLKVAEKILDLDGISGIAWFYLGIDLPKESQDFARDIIKKVKTTFLNLLLVELLLNAIKCADRRAPKIKVAFSLNEKRDHLEINVINNGTVLTRSQFENLLQELAMKHGEKRRALGLDLNKRAAKILGWQLQWREPEEPGTQLTLYVPFRE